MSFTSLWFLILVAAAVIIYYAAPLRFRWILLLLASYAFYVAGGWRTAFYLAFTTCLTYGAGIIIGKLNSDLAALTNGGDKALNLKKRKKLVAAMAIIICFGMLFLLKYWDYAIKALTASDSLGLDLVIPLGVSFYIFQSVGYIIDVYRNKHAPERNLAKFALFVSFFPQIIQGPISRFHELSPQLSNGAKLDFTNIKYGIQLAMCGYFKKLVIADRAGVIVDAVFGNNGAYGGSTIAFAVFFYCIQLYCDFSGGIDIARGVGKMLGIELPQNFRRPLFAVSLTDFWRRWHITLGTWMKDYLFYPLALSKPVIRIGKLTRKKIGGTVGRIIPTSICTFVVYLVIGLWHGANFRFIAFGLWNGVLITASLLLAGTFSSIKKKLRIDDGSHSWRAISMLRTAFIVFLGRYLTRAPRFLAALSMLRRTFADFSVSAFFDGSLLLPGLPQFDIWVVLIATLAMVIIEYFQERGLHVRESLEKRGFLTQWAAIVVPMAAILFLGVFREGYIASQFIYGRY
ncbi:MAG: MBOAT family protein [Oscillospiraceae bacterium]|jgi:D-alanyl-lipoteichoic acid acyltransferase DltB (MBOAT superfamily)|nr:MBOAT family protein [Oscillospiraceae bacterium]